MDHSIARGARESEGRIVKLALAQLAIEDGAIDANRRRAVEAVAAAAADGADLVALPEIVTVGYFAFDEYGRAAEPIEGPTVSILAEAAREHDVAVLAGTIVEDLAATTAVETPAESGLANTAVLLDADGERQLVYRKHHLFGYESREAGMLVAGERIETATIDGKSSGGGNCEDGDGGDGHGGDGQRGIEVGVTTCYDLRFPELYRDLLDAGAELLLVPSAWPEPRVEHWQTLPRARAIENQLYVGAVNGAAIDRTGASLIGRSTVYDPWGTPIAAAGPEPTIVTASVDPGRVDGVREAFPVLADRR